MRSLKGWALAPTSTGATKTGARGRRGLFAGAAVTALLAATLVPVLAAPASADIGGNGIGPNGANGFPSFFSDGTTKLSLCDTGADCVGNLAVDGEAFYFHAAAVPQGTMVVAEFGFEAVSDTLDPAAGCTPATPCNFAFGAMTFKFQNLMPGELYTIRHPYGVNTFRATPPANGGLNINQVIDSGCLGAPCNFATAGAGFLGNYATGVRPTFLYQSNKLDANHIGDTVTPGFVTGAPSGLNKIIVTGPDAGGANVDTLVVDQFNVQGRIDTTATPAVAPNAPINLIATAGNGSVRANWTVPGTGGRALQIYHVRVVDAATGTKVFALRDIPAPQNQAVVSLNLTGLPNGTTFRTQVQAKNVAVAGLGALSNHSNAVTPATVPSKPTIRIATAGIASGTGNWTATFNGGAAIQRYHVRVVDAATGRRVFVLRDVAGSARSLTVALPRGIALRFQVQAINAIGVSGQSNPSNAVIAR